MALGACKYYCIISKMLVFILEVFSYDECMLSLTGAEITDHKS